MNPANPFTVPLGIPKENAIRGETPQEEVEVVFPGEPDAAVYLQTRLPDLGTLAGGGFA